MIERLAVRIAWVLVRAADEAERIQLEKVREAEERIQNVLAVEPFKPKEVYDTILKEALKLVDGRRGQIILVHPDTLTIHATTGSEKRGTPVPFETSFVGKYVVKMGNYAIADDLRKPEFEGAYVNFLGDEESPMLSELAVPVFSGSEMIGVINAESPDPGDFDESDAEALVMLANDTAIALQRAAAREFEEELKEIAGELTEANVPLEELQQKIVERSLDLVKAVSGQFYRVEGDSLKPAASAGERRPTNLNPLSSDSVIRRVIANKEPLIVEDMADWERQEGHRVSRSSVQSLIAVPLLLSGSVVGILNMESNRKGAFSPRHIEMLDFLGRLITLGLHLRETEEMQVHVFHAMKNRLISAERWSKGFQKALASGEMPPPKDIRRLRKMLSDLRDVAQRACTPLNLRPVSITEVLEDFIGTYSNWAGVEVVKPAPTDNGADIPVVAADSDLLRDILSVAVDNAVYAVTKAKREHPTVSFRLAPSGDYIKILIRDNGIGIPEIVKRRLEVEGRGVTTKNRVEGSGIGIPDARHMMHKMLGRIKVPEWTQVGEGTEVSLSLRKVAGVIVLAEHGNNDVPLDVYVFSNNANLIELAQHTLIENDRLKNVDVANTNQLPKRVLDTIAQRPSLLLIDLVSQPRTGLKLFEKLAIDRSERNKQARNESRGETYGVYLFWNIPNSESELLGLVKDALEEAPKGQLA
jgi:GAF domain-containing protein